MSRLYLYPEDFFKDSNNKHLHVLAQQFGAVKWDESASISNFLGRCYIYINQPHLCSADMQSLPNLWFITTCFTYTILAFLRVNIAEYNRKSINVEHIYLSVSIVAHWGMFCMRLQEALKRRITWFDLLYAANFYRINKPNLTIDERFIILFTFSDSPEDECKFIRRVVYGNGPVGAINLQEITSDYTNAKYYYSALNYIKRGIAPNFDKFRNIIGEDESIFPQV
jgi:hypothetical protein